jgi:hypothetical protein
LALSSSRSPVLLRQEKEEEPFFPPLQAMSFPAFFHFLSSTPFTKRERESKEGDPLRRVIP